MLLEGAECHMSELDDYNICDVYGNYWSGLWRPHTEYQFATDGWFHEMYANMHAAKAAEREFVRKFCFLETLNRLVLVQYLRFNLP